MTWRDYPPLCSDLAVAPPGAERIALVGGPVADHTATLWPEERAAVARAGERRRRQFAAGRHLARLAMDQLGVAAGPVGRDENAAPAWPGGLVGSISHSAEVAVAAVAAQGHCLGLGIDLEDPGRVGPRLHPRVFTAAERQLLAAADPRLPGVLFAAKEAGYKAVQPLVGRYIGFHEAEVSVDWNARRWRLRYLGDYPPNRLMERGHGHFCFCGRYVLSLFIIPPEK